jgi:hypothetical protein
VAYSSTWWRRGPSLGPDIRKSPLSSLRVLSRGHRSVI